MMANRLMFAAALAAIAWQGVAAGRAQDVRDDRQANPAVRQLAQTAAPRPDFSSRYAGPPTFHLLGVPAHVWAPVTAPYSGSAYRTFDGQPANSRDALVADANETP